VVASATAGEALASPSRQAVTASAAATATILDPVEVVAVMAAVPEDVAFSSGLLMSRLGADAVGTVMVTVQVVPFPSQGAKGQNQGAAAAFAGIGSASISQNQVQVNGTLQGDPVAAITVSANAGGSLASKGPGTVVLTIEFN
jgi:hypothetical protein